MGKREVRSKEETDEGRDWDGGEGRGVSERMGGYCCAECVCCARG
jgi:hypothetical protein